MVSHLVAGIGKMELCTGSKFYGSGIILHTIQKTIDLRTHFTLSGIYQTIYFRSKDFVLLINDGEIFASCSVKFNYESRYIKQESKIEHRCSKRTCKCHQT